MVFILLLNRFTQRTKHEKTKHKKIINGAVLFSCLSIVAGTITLPFTFIHTTAQSAPSSLTGITRKEIVQNIQLKEPSIKDVGFFLNEFKKTFIKNHFPNGSSDVDILTNGEEIPYRGDFFPFVQITKKYASYKVAQNVDAKGQIYGSKYVSYDTPISTETFSNISKWNVTTTANTTVFSNEKRGRDYLSTLLQLLLQISPYAAEAMSNGKTDLEKQPLWALISSNPFENRVKDLSEYYAMYPESASFSEAENTFLGSGAFDKLATLVIIGGKSLKNILLETESELEQLKNANILDVVTDLRRAVISKLLKAQLESADPDSKLVTNLPAKLMTPLIWFINARFINVINFFDYLLHQYMVKSLVPTEEYKLLKIFDFGRLDNLDYAADDLLNFGETDYPWIKEIYAVSAILVMSVQYMTDSFLTLSAAMEQKQKQSIYQNSIRTAYFTNIYTQDPGWHIPDMAWNAPVGFNPLRFWDPPNDLLVPPDFAQYDAFKSKSQSWAGSVIKMFKDTLDLADYANMNIRVYNDSKTNRYYQNLRYAIAYDTEYAWSQMKAQNNSFSPLLFLQNLSNTRALLLHSPYSSDRTVPRKLSNLRDGNGYEPWTNSESPNSVVDVFLAVVRQMNLSGSALSSFIKIDNEPQPANDFSIVNKVFDLFSSAGSFIPALPGLLKASLNLLKSFIPTFDTRQIVRFNSLEDSGNWNKYYLYGESVEDVSFLGFKISERKINELTSRDIPVVYPISMAPFKKGATEAYFYSSDETIIRNYKKGLQNTVSELKKDVQEVLKEKR